MDIQRLASAEEPRVIVDGSVRTLAPAAKKLGPVDPKERIDVTIRLRPQKTIPDGYRADASRDAVEARFASRADDAARIGAFAHANGLDVVTTDLTAHQMVVSGDAAHLSQAFNVEMARYASPDGEFRGREGSIAVPASVADAVTGVFGLDDREQGTARYRPLTSAPRQAFTPLDVAHAYDFPDGDGRGAHIAVISLGGRYDDAVQAQYLKALGVPHTAFSVKNVDGGADRPSDPGPTGENTLDAEMIGALAPAADKTMYIAPNSDRGFLDALSTAIHDKAHRNDTISISWGSPEENYTPQFFRAMNEELREAKAMGINVFAASGDNGATDGAGDGRKHVDFPSASDGAIACGGTKLTVRNGAIAKEVVWNELPEDGATGGGVSDRVPLPPFQNGAHVPPPADPRGGRGVPDIAGDADPVTGYVLLLPSADGGKPNAAILGGTSAVAPLYAALSARIAQNLGHPVHDLESALYDAPASAFHDVTSGDNGGYKAGPGWDAATGRGSIDGEKLTAYLRERDRAVTQA